MFHNTKMYVFVLFHVRKMNKHLIKKKRRGRRRRLGDFFSFSPQNNATDAATHPSLKPVISDDKSYLFPFPCPHCLLGAIPSELSKHESIKITFPPIRVPKRRVVVICMNGFVEEPDDRWGKTRKAGSVEAVVDKYLLIKIVLLCPSVLVSEKMKSFDVFYEQRLSDAFVIKTFHQDL